MPTRVKSAVIGFFAVALCAALWAPVVASAGQRAPSTSPQLSLSFLYTHVQDNTPIHETVTSSNLKPKSAVLIEEQVGLDHTWKVLVSVKPDAKVSGTLKGNGLGRYYYRVIAMANHVAYLIKMTTEIWSYGTISLAVLCDNTTCYSNTGTVQIGGTVFSYVVRDEVVPGGGGSNYDTLVQFPVTSCRWLNLAFGVTGNNGPVSLGVAQGKTAEQSTTGANETINNWKATLDGTPWYLDDWANNRYTQVFVNGSANCWSSDGKT
jgi:hypothetical protein